MIYEYAMDPQFLLELAGQAFIANILRGEFEPGSACVLAGYPDSLGAIAYAMVKEELAKAKEPKQIAKLQRNEKEVTQLAAGFAGPDKKRTKRYGTDRWCGSFAAEHERLAFAGILSGKGDLPSNLPIKNMDWIRTEGCPLFSYQRGVPVRRTEQDLCNALTPLLQNASELTFVDPYFYPDDRYTSSYSLYFQAIGKVNCIRSQGEREVIIVCARDNANPNKSIPFDEFFRSCNQLQAQIPDGLSIRIHRIKSHERGQEIHNRYILSDIGGVLFGHGTDISASASRGSGTDSYDDITLLGKDQWQQRRKAYTPGSDTFDWSEPPIIIGRQGAVVSGR